MQLIMRQTPADFGTRLVASCPTSASPMRFALPAILVTVDAFGTLPDAPETTPGGPHHLTMTRVRMAAAERTAYKAHLEDLRTGRRRLSGDAASLVGDIANVGEFYVIDALAFSPAPDPNRLALFPARR